MVYDGILFGNGMSINLLSQLKKGVPEEKQYLLNLDSFIKYWIEGELTERENRQLYRAFYGNSKDKWKYYESMKSSFAAYYEKYDSNIEYAMGCLLFKDEEIKECFQIFPALYNIWHIILKDYLLCAGALSFGFLVNLLCLGYLILDQSSMIICPGIPSA